MTFVKNDVGWHDSETGEILTEEEMELMRAGQEAARGFIRYDRARLAYEAKKAEVEAAILDLFPELARLKHDMEACKHEYATRQEALRQMTLNVNEQAVTTEKTFLQGAVTVALSKRKTHYDPQAAHDWIVEMKRFDLFIPNEKALLELAKAGLLPAEVMRWEPVKETRISESKLSALVEIEEVQS